MDLDDWYDLVQEPLPSNPPEFPWRAWALAAAGLVAVAAVVLGVVVLSGGDDGSADDVATIGSSLPPSDAGSTSSTSTSRRSRDTTSTTGTSTSTTTPPPTVGGVTETRPADTTTAPPPPPGPAAAPTTTMAPPPPPPPPAPAQPVAKSSGDLLVEVHLSSTDPAAGQRVVVAVHYVDERGALDLIDVRWGDGAPPGLRDPVPPCSEPGGPPAGREDRTVQLAHTWRTPGRYVVRVLVRTDDCLTAPDEVVVSGEVLVR